EFARKEWTAVDPSTNFSEDCGYDTPGVVHIPDPFFKKILIENHSINTNGDQEIQLSEAESYTGTINCSFNNISSLIGIGAFTGITTLDCSGNLLTSLDVSLLPRLVDLRCFD